MEERVSILILNHGCFGEEMIRSAEMIVGKSENIRAVSLNPGVSIEEYYESVKKVITSLTGETIVLCDLYGGTPCNVAMILSREYSLRVICGLNLPMLIELLLNRINTEDDAKKLVDSVIHTGQQSIYEPQYVEVDDE